MVFFSALTAQLPAEINMNFRNEMCLKLDDPSFSTPLPQPPIEKSGKKDFQALLREKSDFSGILTINGRKEKVEAKDLQFVADIGHGSCGTVSKRTYRGVIMAVKAMPWTNVEIEMKRILTDLDVICRSYDCDYIVKSMGYFILEKEVRLCMEYMATCLDRLLLRMNPREDGVDDDENRPTRGIPEEIIGKISFSVIKALHYLKHTHNIMHRDVKPSNILLDWSGVVKLCDFGISGFLIESRAQTNQAGCPLYMGPERLRTANANAGYDIKSDVWSLGVTLVELATGRYPFKGSEFNMITSILEGPAPSLEEGKFSPMFINMTNRCLKREPRERPNYNQLLEDEFIIRHEHLETDIENWFADEMEAAQP